MKSRGLGVGGWGLAGAQLVACVVGLCGSASRAGPAQGAPQRRGFTVAAGTSLHDSGLIDSLIAAYQQQTGQRVRLESVATGHAFELAQRGDADVVVGDAPLAEQAFVRSGHGLRRRAVAWNYFTIAGPNDDPAVISAAASPADALLRISAERGAFISRGDSSGAHEREMALWRKVGGKPAWFGYSESGQGAGATLLLANRRRAYTLVDRATLQVYRGQVDLIPLRGEVQDLRNVYHVVDVTATAHSAQARGFSDWLLSPAAQRLIESFGVSRFGEPLYKPAHGREP